MTRYRGFVLGAVAWVVVVTAGALLVWTVISDAGAGVAGDLPAKAVTSTAGPQASGQSAPTATPTATGPATPSTSVSAPPGDEPVRRSWEGAAGAVVAECRGGAIALSSARPSSGWSVEVDDSGPDDLRVEFESADDARVRVEASCVDGAPSFTVDSD